VDVTTDTIRHIAKLARLSLTEAEVEAFVPQFQEILGLFAELDAVDVSEAAPSFHALQLGEALADDAPEACLSQEQALSLTPHRQDGYFKGPKVV